jgi:hypothetical protein
MFKATARDIRLLQRWGKENEVVADLMKRSVQPRVHEIAYFAPASANWSWIIGIIQIKGDTYELLTRFGVVEGGRQIWVDKYNEVEDTK